MFDYYLNNNPQPSGEHEVHRNGCKWDANTSNQIPLGSFLDGVAAVARAKEMYPSHAHLINGCIHCNPEANTD